MSKRVRTGTAVFIIVMLLSSGFFDMVFHINLFKPKIAQAAFSSPTARGSGIRAESSGTTVAVTPSGNITVGKIAFMACATDNTATANGASSNHDTVTDTDSHTWTEVFEENDSDGTAADGSTISLWWTRVQTQIDTTDTVTLTMDTARLDGICSLSEVTVAAGFTVTSSADTPTHSDSGTSLSETRSGLTSKEYLFFGFFGSEGEDNAKTAIANYAEILDSRTSASGNADLNINIHVATRILTGTGDTWTSSAVAFTNGMQSLTAFSETASAAPTITVNQPDGTSDEIAEGANYTVNYDLADTDDVVTANFAYDADASGFNGTNIAGCVNRAEGTGSTCTWNTTGVAPGTYYVHGTSTDGATAAQDYSSGVVTINDSPAANVDQPDGTGDTVTVGDNYSIQYDLADTDNTVTMAFYYDTDSSGLDGTSISGACATAAEGTDATCSWNTTGVTPGSYYVYGITNDGVNAQVSDYSSGQITINSLGSLSLTASSTNSFDTALTLSFSSQTSTMSSIGAIKVSDDRGGSPGWTLSLTGNDWTSGTGIMQLDYDGTGSNGNLGKLCPKPNNGTLYAESGSLTGVSKGSNVCFSSGVTSATILSATNGNGTGIYWLTDMPAEQFFPSSPTVASYTTTMVLTLTYHDTRKRPLY